jgi:DNA-binding transcriptional MerR regulator/methylmalonyl-CoA mutase cobalamin-binding subunit
VEKSSAKYPIRAVAKITGLAIDTLRAWERRHAAVTPTRDLRGRLYTDEDVERLRLLREAVANGHAIGRIAGLDDARLRELAAAATAAPTAPAPLLRTAGPGSPTRQPRWGGAIGPSHIVSALDRFDHAFVATQLAHAAALLSPTELLRDLILPALREIGDTWHSRPLGIAQEHLLSSAVRSLLGSLMRVHARTDVPGRLLFATPSGERHEFGALGGALIATSGGLGATYLGADLPSNDIVEMAAVMETDVVVLGITVIDEGSDRVLDELRFIARQLPRDVELWLGGPAAARIASDIHPRALVVQDYDTFETELVRIGARF